MEVSPPSASTAPSAFPVIGQMPQGLRAATETFPNSEAVQLAQLVPDLDRGFTAQGVAIDGRTLFIGGYLSGDRPACRLFAVESGSNKLLGQMDVPGPCKHAGGLTKIGPNQLLISDTRDLLHLTFPDAEHRRALAGASLDVIPLEGQLRGSFVVAHGSSFYLGTYSTTCDDAVLYGFGLDLLRSRKLSVKEAQVRIQLPTHIQGALFADDHTLLLSSSRKSYGLLTEMKLDPPRITQSSPFVRGVEGLTLDDQGFLWTVSESGSKQYQDWVHAMPAALKIDRSKLAKSAEEPHECVR